MSKSNYQVAHEFAYGARSGKSLNMFIDGDCIYSYGYHFCIAKRVNEDTILFTTRSYSVSTTSHCSYVGTRLVISRRFIVRIRTERIARTLRRI